MELRDATPLQRSAFADAVEILSELHSNGVSLKSITRALECSEDEFSRAHSYMKGAYYARNLPPRYAPLSAFKYKEEIDAKP